VSKTFAVTGVGGFVAPRHLEAIAGVQGKLIGALDPSDSVGILDRYSRDCAFFTEPERFWRWVSRRDFEGQDGPDWIVVCSPNWLHDAHVRMALFNDCKVILEKPAVLRKRNLEQLLAEFPDASENVFVVHQLRWHPDAVAMFDWVRRIRQTSETPYFRVNVTYHTPRGPWYHYSWKGDVERSGGPIFNLGIHFLDLLCWVFGKHESVRVDCRNQYHVDGVIQFPGTEVRFSLSNSFSAVGRDGAPQREFVVEHVDDRYTGRRIGAPFTFRFDQGFTGLHDKVYEDAMQGDGIRLEEVSRPVSLAEEILFADICRL